MDRLLKTVDKFLDNHSGYEVVVQAGATQESFTHFQPFSTLKEAEFRWQFEQADVIISHAGMGNILLAQECQKPIVLMPRRSEFHEHVNDHQLDTVKGFQDRQFIYCIDDATGLGSALEWAKKWEPSVQPVPEREKLVLSLKQFIRQI